MKPHRILHGDVWACLLTLEDASIDCVVTSPPYWQQRDYGFQGQLGREDGLEDYLAKLVQIFDLLRFKLVSKGVFYLNLGDKYITKYGNTSLALIPFKLAYFLKKSGWHLEDILIWYKPNHMPSSVKNRFTNTYEPIFVLTRNQKNYYEEYKKLNPFSAILSIPLQSLPYKHMASFPEKLVETLLSMGLPETARILDPFAGSGTTCVAAQNISSGYFNKIKMTSVMIEANPEFIRIIQERCKLQNSTITRVPSEKYPEKSLPMLNRIPKRVTTITVPFPFLRPKMNKVFLEIFQSSEEFNSFYPELNDESVYSTMPDDAIYFIGLSKPIIEDIMAFSHLNRWVIRNIIVVPKNGHWLPIFFLVKDIKSVRYRFNLDRIRISLQTPQETWENTDFLGYRVERTQTLFNNPYSGKIVRVLTKFTDGLPHWVVVHWDSGNNSIEEVLDASDSLQIQMKCPSCSSSLVSYYSRSKKLSCPACNIQLWTSWERIPILSLPKREEPSFKPDTTAPANVRPPPKIYSGKFKNTERLNRGQSPGARSSLEEPFFSVKRYFSVNQPLVCDYLNLHRKKKNLTKVGLTNLFPSKYKHTVGHWLRKDMGGSLPKLDDIQKLKVILDLDDPYVDYIGRTGIKLQTVQTTKKGKNPGDFLDYPIETITSMLQKLGA
ncbi:MAG: DNA-methyltransferase [Candidatus Heimdallarchaeota archaeon]